MPTPSGHRETPAPISAPIAAFLGPVALLCLIWALGCGGNTAAIGVVLPLSGPYSPYGRSLLNGMEAAVEGINETGGIGGRFLKLDVRDGAADPSKSSASLEELFLDSEILAAVGGLTPQTARAMEHVAVRHGKVLLSPAPIEAASSPEGPFLPFWPTAETRAEFAADYAAFTLHASDVLAVGFDEPGSRLRIEAFENRFSNADRKMKSLLVQREEVEGGTWAGDLRRSASGTQVFYLAADGPDLQLLMETLSCVKKGMKNIIPTSARKTVITKYATGELKYDLNSRRHIASIAPIYSTPFPASASPFGDMSRFGVSKTVRLRKISSRSTCLRTSPKRTQPLSTTALKISERTSLSACPVTAKASSSSAASIFSTPSTPSIRSNTGGISSVPSAGFESTTSYNAPPRCRSSSRGVPSATRAGRDPRACDLRSGRVRGEPISLR